MFLSLQFREVLFRKSDEAGAYIAADQISLVHVWSFLGHLDLELARSKSQVENLFGAGVMCWRGDGFMLFDLVKSGDSEIDLAFSDEGGYVCGREEDEGDGVILYEGDVESVVATELNVGSSEEVECGLLEASLCQSRLALLIGRLE